MTKVKIFLSESGWFTAVVDYDELIKTIEHSARSGRMVMLDGVDKKVSFFGNRVILIENDA